MIWTKYHIELAFFSGADLRGADLRGVNLEGANLGPRSTVPESGSFEAYKKLQCGVICRILIPAKSRRVSSFVGRKCRAEYVKVLNGNGIGIHDGTKYQKGKIVRADSYNDDPRIECTNGIHFFMTRKEAEDYV
jgi:hypothetical protein